MQHKTYREFDDYTRRQKAELKEILDACRNITLEQAVLLIQVLTQMCYLSMHTIEEVQNIKNKNNEDEQESL